MRNIMTWIMGHPGTVRAIGVLFMAWALAFVYPMLQQDAQQQRFIEDNTHDPGGFVLQLARQYGAWKVFIGVGVLAMGIGMFALPDVIEALVK